MIPGFFPPASAARKHGGQAGRIQVVTHWQRFACQYKTGIISFSVFSLWICGEDSSSGWILVPRDKIIGKTERKKVVGSWYG
jgi:hypothetical protein